MKEGPARLIYYSNDNGTVMENSIDTYAMQSALKGQGFTVSYQKGINNAIMLKVCSEDYEESRHIDPETGKAAYATQIFYDGAIYDIVWVYQAGEGFVELTCG